MPSRSDYDIGLVKKVSNTEWAVGADCVGWWSNKFINVEVIKEGILIEATVFTWEEVEKAKEFI